MRTRLLSPRLARRAATALAVLDPRHPADRRLGLGLGLGLGVRVRVGPPRLTLTLTLTLNPKPNLQIGASTSSEPTTGLPLVSAFRVRVCVVASTSAPVLAPG